MSDAYQIGLPVRSDLSVGECLRGAAADMRQVTRILDDASQRYTAIPAVNESIKRMREIFGEFSDGLESLDRALSAKIADGRVKAELSRKGVRGDA